MRIHSVLIAAFADLYNVSLDEILGRNVARCGRLVERLGSGRIHATADPPIVRVHLPDRPTEYEQFVERRNAFPASAP